MGLLIAGLRYFGSWTLVVSLQKKKWQNKGIDLGVRYRIRGQWVQIDLTKESEVGWAMVVRLQFQHTEAEAGGSLSLRPA